MITVMYNNHTYTARKLPFCYEPMSYAIHAFRFIVGAGADPNLELGGREALFCLPSRLFFLLRFVMFF